MKHTRMRTRGTTWALLTQGTAHLLCTPCPEEPVNDSLARIAVSARRAGHEDVQIVMGTPALAALVRAFANAAAP